MNQSLVLRNVLYYRRSIVATFLQVLLVSSLASFVYLSLAESVEQTLPFLANILMLV